MISSGVYDWDSRLSRTVPMHFAQSYAGMMTDTSWDAGAVSMNRRDARSVPGYSESAPRSDNSSLDPLGTGEFSVPDLPRRPVDKGRHQVAKQSGTGHAGDEVAGVKGIAGARTEERVVFSFLFGGTSIAEVIEGDRTPPYPLRAGQRFRMAVVRKGRCREDGASVEDRQNLLLATGNVLVPELEVTAVFLFPILVQIQEEVQTPVETVCGVVREVDVDAQFSAALDAVEATSHELRVGDQFRNIRQLFQEAQKRSRVQLMNQPADFRRHAVFIRKRILSLLVFRRQFCPVREFPPGKHAPHGFCNPCGQEVIDDDKGNRFSGAIPEPKICYILVQSVEAKLQVLHELNVIEPFCAHPDISGRNK